MKRKATRDIEALKAEARLYIDAKFQAAMTHPALMSPGSAIATVYQRQEMQAVEYLTNPDAYVPGTYCWLEKLVGVTGEDINQVAQIIVYMADLWEPIGAELNSIRLTAKGMVDAATRISEIDTAKATADSGYEQVLSNIPSL